MEIQITIKDFRLPSFNQFYAQGVSIKRRSNIVWKWKLLIGKQLEKQINKEEIATIRKGVINSLTCYVHFKARPYDVDNCVMYGKLFLDALKGLCEIDDNPKKVRSITYIVDLTKKIDEATYIITCK